jgi:hypothetical protein
MQLEQFNEGLRALAPEEWVEAYSSNDFVLDGHFTLEQLKAIVQYIEQHSSLT